MAARIPRLTRLTLFSGPNCSLCDVAKAELAKVKKIGREFDLEVINIQDKGQERWKKKYVYWIPALHLDGNEIAKGRDAVGTGKGIADDPDTSPTPDFIVDTSSFDLTHVLLGHPCLYDRVASVALGQVEQDSESSFDLWQDIRRCFNCGSPDHSVASCTEPLDRQLVALSRQLFNFLHPDRVGQETSRFYLAEGWKQLRLKWLQSYEPG
ncbi:hypothetical protein HYDPIDRAFT_56545, partial [Hydnomerulius pinastri MD-312]